MKTFSTLLALAAASALGAARAAETASAPLPAALAADLAGIEFDDPPEALVNDIHYVASDEGHHVAFRPHIENRGGVFIGIGTNQNYTMLTWIRPELAVMLDFDQFVVEVHHLYRVALATATTPAEFIELWRPNSRERFRARIAEFFSEDAAQRDAAIKVYEYSRFRIDKALRRDLQMVVEAKAPSYLNDQAEYDYLVAMSKAGRIVAVRGDLTKQRTMTQLGAVLAKHGLVVRVYHPSNAEQYFPFDAQYRTNVRALPVDARSMVIRTRAWARLEPLTAEAAAELDKSLAAGSVTLADDAPERQKPPKRKAIYYTYATQDFADFLAWLELPKVRNVRKLLPFASRVENAHFHLGPPPAPAPAKPAAP